MDFSSMQASGVNNWALGQSGQDPGVVIPESNPLGFFSLWTRVTNAGKADPLYKNFTAYQVPVGKTFKHYMTRIEGDTAGDGVLLLTDTVAIAEDTALVALTAPQYQGGVATNRYLMQIVVARTPICHVYPFDFAASKYLGVSGSAGGLKVLVIGREV